MELALLLAFALGMSMTQRSVVGESKSFDADISSELLMVVVIVAVLGIVGVMILFKFM